MDSDEEEIAVARTRSPSRGRLTWHAADIGSIDPGTGFDAAICVGATHAFGPPGKALERTLETMCRYVRKGGRFLVGEGYWRRDPPKAYLSATPFEGEHLVGHETNKSLCTAAGWTLIHSEVSSVLEWDEFESAFLRNAEAWFEEAPDDEAAIEAVKHWRSWNEAYLRWVGKLSTSDSTFFRTIIRPDGNGLQRQGRLPPAESQPPAAVVSSAPRARISST